MPRIPLPIPVLLSLLLGCPTDDIGDDDTIGAITPPWIGEEVWVVPSDGLPAEVELQDAANNLDVVEHDGRVFFAFRAAPSHFASPETVLYVVSSADQTTWRFEGSFRMETDLREPRLLSHGGRLWLYYAVLGQSATDFEPQGTMVAEYLGEGSWSEAEWIFDEGFIPWRVRVIEDTAYLIGYIGGEDIYDFAGGTEYVYWYRLDEGLTWEPVVPGQPIVHEGGVSETDFAFLDDGAVVAVGRNELGDEDGWGSKICRAEADDLGDWTCAVDPRKYDSPLVFTSGGRVWLIGRRNLTETGNYDLFMRDLEPSQQTLHYLVDYWAKPKRCSLWQVDPDALEVTFVLDLPSRGDTCFASALQEGEGEFTIYNYTSPLEGPDISWLDGQTGETMIYRIDLHIP